MTRFAEVITQMIVATALRIAVIFLRPRRDKANETGPATATLTNRANVSRPRGSIQYEILNMPGVHFQATVEQVCSHLLADAQGNLVPVADLALTLAPNQPAGQSYFPFSQGQVQITIENVTGQDLGAGDMVQVDIVRVSTIVGALPPPP